MKRSLAICIASVVLILGGLVAAQAGAATETVSASGGSKTFTASVSYAKTCEWSSSPKIAGFAATVRCETGTVARSARFKANTSTTAKSYTITLTVRGSTPPPAIIHWKVDQAGRKPSTTAIPSVALNAQTTNYIGAQSRLLTDFAVGVGTGDIAPNTFVALSENENGVVASGQVAYGPSLETANGFNLDFSSKLTNQSGVSQVIGRGNILVASTDSIPSLTPASRTSHLAHLTPAEPIRPSRPRRPSSAIGLEFNIGSDSGGTLNINDSQFNYTDRQGTNVKFTFPNGENIESEVNAIRSANVRQPSAAQVKEDCDAFAVGGVINEELLLNSVDASANGKQSIVSLIATKSVLLDCATESVTTTTRLDVQGDIDGQGFLAISDSGPQQDVSAPDETPATPVLPSSTYDVSPSEADLVPMQILPDGDFPTSTTTPGTIDLNSFQYACNTPATPLPGWINCTGTVNLSIDTAVTGGVVSVYFNYPDSGSFFEGQASVTAVTTNVPVTNSYIPDCVKSVETIVEVYGGPTTDTSAPLLASFPETVTTSCTPSTPVTTTTTTTSPTTTTTTATTTTTEPSGVWWLYWNCDGASDCIGYSGGNTGHGGSYNNFADCNATAQEFNAIDAPEAPWYCDQTAP